MQRMKSWNRGVQKGCPRFSRTRERNEAVGSQHISARRVAEELMPVKDAPFKGATKSL